MLETQIVLVILEKETRLREYTVSYLIIVKYVFHVKSLLLLSFYMELLFCKDETDRSKKKKFNLHNFYFRNHRGLYVAGKYQLWSDL